MTEINKISQSICPICTKKIRFKTSITIKKWQIISCPICHNSFLNPVPSNIKDFYPSNYWIDSGIFGFIKKTVHPFFQLRRVRWVTQYLTQGTILDIGCGEGEFGKSAGEKLKVIGIDLAGAEIKNPAIIKKDFLSWETTRLFDAVVYWESLEHVYPVPKYLKRSAQMLKKGGLVFVECPRGDCTEAKFFGKNWYHLDPPRHISHFSKNGLQYLLRQQKFEILEIKSVFAPEYIYAGMMVSLLNLFGFDLVGQYIDKKNLIPIMIFTLLFSPLLVIGFLIQTLLCFFDNSPIQRVVARKIN